MKNYELNERDLMEVTGGTKLVLQMDPEVMEQVKRNAQPLAPTYVNPNPGGLPKAKKQYTGCLIIETPKPTVLKPLKTKR